MVSLGVWKARAIGGEKLLHTSFQAGRWLSKPCPVQFAHICLRKVLILTAQRYRHVNIADTERAPQRGTHGQDYIVKGAHTPCPAVEQTTHVRVLPQPEEMADAIRDTDKIALLATIRVRCIRGPKQHDLTGSDKLVVGLPDHTRHTTLVGFTWSVNIKKLQASPTRWCRLPIRDFPQYPLIEHIFTFSVEVQWLKL